MGTEESAPCRHAGAPSTELIDKVAGSIDAIRSNRDYLASQGISPEEFDSALPAAIQRLRGRDAASTSDRKRFLRSILEGLPQAGLASRVDCPTYGNDTIYRVVLPDFGDVAVIQKGCPDGAHSSTAWAVPSWAKETYLWWLCPSLAHEPGDHVYRGINRLKKRFFSDESGQVDAVVFHNEMCGTPSRPCPKSGRSRELTGQALPPPCIYVLPRQELGTMQWNWDGTRRLVFAEILLSLFGVDKKAAPSFTGFAGYKRAGAEIRVRIDSHYGPGRSTTFRS